MSHACRKMMENIFKCRQTEDKFLIAKDSLNQGFCRSSRGYVCLVRYFGFGFVAKFAMFKKYFGMWFILDISEVKYSTVNGSIFKL